MYVNTYIYLYMHMYVHKYSTVCIIPAHDVRTHTHIFVYIYIYIHMYVCTERMCCVSAILYARTYIYLRTRP